MKERFVDIYKPLVAEFTTKIKTARYDSIPEPFLPVYGKNYENQATRIVFVGMETNGWENLHDFVDMFKTNPDEVIFREFESFNKFDFCSWGNNTGKTFWGFIFKFLANFYNIDDWKKIKRGEIGDILKSFAWGNVNSIERFEVSAKKNGVTIEDWTIVKNASLCFDKFQYLQQALQPNILVLLNCAPSEKWLIEGLNKDFIKVKVDDHFWYYFLKDTQTHILWTAHPTWLSRSRDFDNYNKYLTTFIKQKLL